MSSKPDLKIFSGRGSEYIARQIAEKYGKPLGEVKFFDFSDGEMQPSFNESVRGAYVYLVQSTFTPIDNLFELLLMIDAAYRASAYKIIAVIPYFGYGRQDRKDKPRVAIGAKLIANMLAAAGVSRVMTMDLHADQIQGFFDVPVDHIFASTIFVPYIINLKLDNLVVASPDMGGTKRANAYANHLHTGLVVCHKARSGPNEIADMRIIGDVQDKNVVILDDIVDTAGTLTKAAKLMIDNGAKSVRAAITHPVLSADAYKKINDSALTELIVTDSIPLKQECDKITVLPIAELFATVMHQIYDNKSISSSFIL